MGRSKVVKLKSDEPATWEEAEQQFLWFKQAQNLSETTIAGYKVYIKLFFKQFPEAYEQEKLKNSVMAFMGQPAKPSHYNLKLIYLRTFFNWCISEGIFSENPLTGIKKMKDDGRVVNLDSDTVSLLISLPDKTTFAGLRDYALILLTIDTGIRPKEAFGLIISDFNFRVLQVTVRPEVAKTRTARTLSLSPITVQTIRELIAARHSAWQDSTPVFPTIDGGKLNKNTWGLRMAKYSHKLGVKIRPYDLRHFYATQSLLACPNVHALRAALGHSTLFMAQRYLHLVEDDITEWHTASTPLNSLLPQRHRVRKVKK